HTKKLRQARVDPATDATCNLVPTQSEVHAATAKPRHHAAARSADTAQGLNRTQLASFIKSSPIYENSCIANINPQMNATTSAKLTPLAARPPIALRRTCSGWALL